MSANDDNSIPVFGSIDRLGTNILYNFSSILYAHKFNIPLHYTEYNKRGSIFLEANKIFSNNYIPNRKNLISNNRLEQYQNFYKNSHTKIRAGIPDFYYTHALTCTSIKQDYVSYFKDNLQLEYNKILKKLAKQKGYKISFDPKKSICVHIRLGDVSDWEEGSHEVCNDVYRDYIDNDDLNSCLNICKYRQSPINKYKLFSLVEKANKKYPNREVLLFTNCGENLDLPYRCISTNDEDLDLYCMCKSEVLITSRSTFGMIPLFIGNCKDIWFPKWCASAVMGLTTKYDFNLNINYY